DKLKTISKGYASFDYTYLEYKISDLVKIDILINYQNIDALSALVHKNNAFKLGKKICEKLHNLIPRQQFDIPIQAAIGNKIISRETIKAIRKDVTSKCYGGDISRKRKLLEKQKKGKKKMRKIGQVKIPKYTFMEVFKFK
ncbi:MAG: elongation factor 4, partial [Flavobacteriia bacterium]|nr:elongation factor 4 [Candidatus Bostrichicola ureolyticus]